MHSGGFNNEQVPIAEYVAPLSLDRDREQFVDCIGAVNVDIRCASLDGERILQANLLSPTDALSYFLVDSKLIDVAPIVEKYSTVDHETVIELERNNLLFYKF